jgi:hypothetical protein
MPYRRRLSARLISVVLAALVALLWAAIPASAATSHQSAGVAEAWYNAGDNDPTYGPNSFLLRYNSCGSYLVYVSYSWAHGSGTPNPTCGADKVISLAPLGPNAYPLRWRICWIGVHDPTHLPHCQPFTDDFVYTT